MCHVGHTGFILRRSNFFRITRRGASPVSLNSPGVKNMAHVPESICVGYDVESLEDTKKCALKIPTPGKHRGAETKKS
jgi:hypothetical protein